MERKNKSKSIAVVLGIIMFLLCTSLGLVGYFFQTELKFALCMASKDKSQCPKILLIEKGKSEELVSGVPIQGSSGLYTITPPSDRWLKNGWSGRPAENKDLGILSETGTAYLDFTIVVRGEETAEALSKSGIQWAINRDKSSSGELTTTPVEVKNASEKAFISRYCAKDGDVFSCAYSFVVPTGKSFIVASGSCVNVGNQLVEFEEMLLSIELTHSQ
ncbi:MAG: hypothetical protein ACOYYF_16140 [Chloroflexota bacterium]|nr:hypothetical protein [Chloroflexota bacterium]MBI5704594.1 hypothetical protein [Chloroflexota bacterium]